MKKATRHSSPMSTRTAIVQDINLRRLSTDFDIPNLRWQLQYHSHSLFTCVVCCYHQIYRLINVLSLSLIRIFCSRKWCFLSVAWMGKGGGGGGGGLLEMALLMEGIRNIHFGKQPLFVSRPLILIYYVFNLDQWSLWDLLGNLILPFIFQAYINDVMILMRLWTEESNSHVLSLAVFSNYFFP